MSKRTPGPWAFEARNDGSFEVTAEKGGHGGGFYVVCARGQHGMADTTKADARLIAAAPELLEAMYPFIVHCSSDEFVTIRVRSSDVEAGRAAIAKATGAEA